MKPAIVIDRDGTLASVAWKAPKTRDKAEWAEFNAALPFDSPVPIVAGLLRSIRPGVTRIMTTGRQEGDWPGDRRRRFLMQGWLEKYDLPIDLLIMRSGGDQRRDSVVKAVLYHEHIEPFFDVRFVIEDRPSVCDLWRSLGLSVLQVVDPDIPPVIGAGET